MSRGASALGPCMFGGGPQKQPHSGSAHQRRRDSFACNSLEQLRTGHPPLSVQGRRRVHGRSLKHALPPINTSACFHTPSCRDGDVYVGGRWNTLSILYAIFFFTPLLGLLFAWATYGTLWATGTYY